MDKYVASLEEKVTLTKSQLKAIITCAYWRGNDAKVGENSHHNVNELFSDALDIIGRLTKD